ncbi:MAG: hypothetical protein H6835_19920 [Planctomycetes bacterium]|nr:hypothetical protein [Planctomycetota bacterium]
MNPPRHNPLVRIVAPLLLAAASGAGAFALHGCARPAPAAETRILELDGIALTFDQVKPYVEFLRSFRPDAGEKTMTMYAINEHLLPLRLAQRAFPEQRKQLLEQAQGLCSVADNVIELEKQTAQMGERVYRDRLTRTAAQLPVAMFLFDPANVGAASQPIEVPQGWFVVGAFDLKQEALAIGDRADALQVGFVTHLGPEWKAWLAEQQQQLADKLTFVHPDYRDSLPAWIRPPRQQ